MIWNATERKNLRVLLIKLWSAREGKLMVASLTYGVMKVGIIEFYLTIAFQIVLGNCQSRYLNPYNSSVNKTSNAPG